VTSPHSPLREALYSLGDIFSRQAGITIGARQSKRPRMETRPSIGPTSHPHLTLASPYFCLV
jgi:hypothetical protein